MCKCCKNDGEKLAIEVNNVKLCFRCVDFFKNTAQFNGRTAMQEIEHQTEYIAAHNAKLTGRGSES